MKKLLILFVCTLKQYFSLYIYKKSCKVYNYISIYKYVQIDRQLSMQHITQYYI